jgi:tRNA (guanine-N7-)-methyltransferase
MLTELSEVTEHSRNRIATVVTKHARTHYRLPISATMRDAIAPAIERLRCDAERGRPLVLDAGCGTGHSTRYLAISHPEATVLGVDRSLVRLRKAPRLPENALCIRARLEEFWLLAREAHIVFAKTYLLYPNPYPKSSQLKHRWYGHPIFPIILETTRELELRTNQKWYADECSIALLVMGWRCSCSVLEGDDIFTPFELKYADRGELRYRVCATPVEMDSVRP